MQKTKLDFTPYRLENETREEYKNRRKVCKMFEKAKLKGQLYWDSSQRGTYIKKDADKIIDEIQRNKERTKKPHKR